jgi:hypothetical protein
VNAHVGNEVCSETIVIRSNDEWKRVIRSLGFDGERYHTTELRQAGSRLNTVERDHDLFALLGASS